MFQRTLLTTISIFVLIACLYLHLRQQGYCMSPPLVATMHQARRLSFSQPFSMQSTWLSDLPPFHAPVAMRVGA